MSKPLSPKSQHAWDVFRQRMAELNVEVLETEWLGALTPHRCRCANGHECSPRPNDIQQGDGTCRKCAAEARGRKRSLRGWENFHKEVSWQGGVVLEKKWLGSGVPHLCLCAKGHKCRPTPCNAQHHGICRICAKNDPTTAREDFYKRLTEKGHIVLEQRWLGKCNTHRCLCVNGHECNPRPAQVREGWGICRICAGLDQEVAAQNFYRRMAELNVEVLEPRWLGALKRHLCRCPKGHERKVLPNAIQQGEGACRVCADINNPETARRKAVAGENFYKAIPELGGEVLEPKYLGNNKPHRCRCPNGHECWPSPSSIQSSQGMCRICSWREQDVLYVVRDPLACRVKFGITSKDGSIRLRKHEGDGFSEVIFLKTGLPKRFAALVEQKIIHVLKEAGAKPVQGREYFSDENMALVLNEINVWVTK